MPINVELKISPEAQRQLEKAINKISASLDQMRLNTGRLLVSVPRFSQASAFATIMLREKLEARIHAICPNEAEANRIIAMCRQLKTLEYQDTVGDKLAQGWTSDEVCYYLFNEGAVFEEELKTNPVDDEAFFK